MMKKTKVLHLTTVQMVIENLLLQKCKINGKKRHEISCTSIEFGCLYPEFLVMYF